MKSKTDAAASPDAQPTHDAPGVMPGEHDTSQDPVASQLPTIDRESFQYKRLSAQGDIAAKRLDHNRLFQLVDLAIAEGRATKSEAWNKKFMALARKLKNLDETLPKHDQHWQDFGDHS
jgi:hypothetical protein